MKILAITISLFYSMELFSQFETTNSFGLNFNRVNIDNSSRNYFCFIYNPRIDYKMTKEMSFSLTSYLSFGISEKQNQFMGQAPLIGQFNFGKNSTKESEEMIGCFVGLGRAIGCYPNNQILNGMYFTTGLSFGKEQVISIRFEMTSGRLKPDGKFNNVIGLGLSYHLFK